MSDIQALCEGVAANLLSIRNSDPKLVKQVHPFQLTNPTATSLMVYGVLEFDYVTYGSPAQPPGMRYLIGVEAWIGLASDIGSQIKLRSLLAAVGDDSLVAAVEAAGTERARLTARLNSDGELTEDQPPACEQISFEEYRGSAKVLGDNATEYLTATWVFEVLT